MFKKGASGNPNGRPKGSKDKVTTEVRELARSLFDKAYWARTKDLLDRGQLHPKMESTLLAYAFGLPKMDTEPKGQGLVVNLGFVALQPAEPQNELPEPSIVLALPPGKAPN